jgi:hypothetical protein
LRKIWIKQCHRNEKFNGEISRVCAEHFEESDFQNLMEIKLMHGKRLLLNKDALPKINLKPAVTQESSNASTLVSQRTIHHKKNKKCQINQLLISHLGPVYRKRIKCLIRIKF